ncbi:MAG: hypothetical protein ABMA64_36100 [Myxococcota bacterium]
MKYEDLSPYSEQLGFDARGIVNVGWLDASRIYPTGRIEDSTFWTKLGWLTLHARAFSARAVSPCPICRTVSATWEGQRLGLAELWVPSASTDVFVCPDLISHFITEHFYRPPQIFVEAVLQYPPSLARDWDASSFAEFAVCLLLKNHRGRPA